MKKILFTLLPILTLTSILIYFMTQNTRINTYMQPSDMENVTNGKFSQAIVPYIDDPESIIYNVEVATYRNFEKGKGDPVEVTDWHDFEGGTDDQKQFVFQVIESVRE